jgi:hypothetical protein
MNEKLFVSDIEDALLCVKVDGRVYQVVLTREQAKTVVRFAAQLTEVLQLDEKDVGVDWERKNEKPN